MMDTTDSYRIDKGDVCITIERNRIQFEGDEEGRDADGAGSDWCDGLTEKIEAQGYWHPEGGGKLGYGHDTTAYKVFVTIRDVAFWPTRAHYDPTPNYCEPDMQASLDAWAEEFDDPADFDRALAKVALLEAARRGLEAAQRADD